jgi:hypothetical protein
MEQNDRKQEIWFNCKTKPTMSLTRNDRDSAGPGTWACY